MRKQVTEQMAENRTIEYTYDNLNRLVTEDAKETTSGQDYAYLANYVYDLAGNRTSRDITVTYYQDPGNPTRQQKITTTYLYYPDGSGYTDKLQQESHSITQISMVLPQEDIYVCSSSGGRFHHTKGFGGKRIGQLHAMLLGLPTALSRYVFGIAIALLVVMLFVARLLLRRRGQPRLSLFHRSLCILLTYIMLISPAGFEQLAQADVQYQDLLASDWGKDGESINYTYDNNGSLVSKVVNDGGPQVTFAYEYNLQNRLARITKTIADSTIAEITEYKYNPDGIRVAKHTWTEDDGTPQGDDVYTDYLIDAYNHSGYAQVSVEDDATDVTSYVIGDDVLAQATNTNDSEYLLYDGHGSTRQLVASDGSTVNDSFSYDGYGVLLGGERPTTTNLLYTGETYDQHAAQYYLRARWYNALTGLFNRVDPFSGNTQDPQSLHKYLYCHANPVNTVDPSGNAVVLGGGLIMNFTVQTAIRAAIAASVFGVMAATFAKVRGATWTQAIWAGVKAAAITGFAFMSPLFAWGLLAIAPIIMGLGIYSGDITKEDIPEIAAYVAAGILLLILFKTPQYKVWEAKTAIKLKLPKAIKNLQTRHSINPARDIKWEKAVSSGNKTAQGSLIHAELADLMRAEKMTNLKIEVSYNSSGDIVRYGTKGSIRLDYGVYHNETLIKAFELKPGDVMDGSWLQKASQYTKLSPEDFEAISYGGK